MATNDGRINAKKLGVNGMTEGRPVKMGRTMKGDKATDKSMRREVEKRERRSTSDGFMPKRETMTTPTPKTREKENKHKTNVEGLKASAKKVAQYKKEGRI